MSSSAEFYDERFVKLQGELDRLKWHLAQSSGAEAGRIEREIMISEAMLDLIKHAVSFLRKASDG